MSAKNAALHLWATSEDLELLDKLATAFGTKKATLARLALAHWVRDPRVHALAALEDEDVRTYLLEQPAAFEFVHMAKARRLTDVEWGVLLERLEHARR